MLSRVVISTTSCVRADAVRLFRPPAGSTTVAPPRGLCPQGATRVDGRPSVIHARSCPWLLHSAYAEAAWSSRCGDCGCCANCTGAAPSPLPRSEEHTSELQSRGHLVCRLLLEKK